MASTTMNPVFNVTVHATGNGDDIAAKLDEVLRHEFTEYMNLAAHEHAWRSLR